MKTISSISNRLILSILTGLALSFSVSAQIKVAVEKGNSQVIPFDGVVDTFQVQMLPQQGGSRLIYWIHGLAGDASSWEMAGQWTQLYGNSICVYPEYFGNNLYDAAVSLGLSIENIAIPLEAALNITDPSSGLAIAHSQGGLVSRRLQKMFVDGPFVNQQRHFSRLITFGSPHQGAKLANNIESLKQYIADALVTLSKGPALEMLSEHWYLNMFISGSNLTNLLEQFAMSVPENILPVVLGDFAQKITESYQQGASDIIELNSSPYPYRMLAFYGVEDDPVLWRLLYSLNHDIGAEGIFNADYDEGYISVVHENYTENYMKYIEFQNAADELFTDKSAWWQWMLNPMLSTVSYCWDDILDGDDYFGYGENSMQEIADAYKEAASWWMNANEDYKYFIGASEIQSFIHPIHYICRCEYFANGTEIIEHTYQSLATPCVSANFPSASCESIPIVITNFIERESDGVVTAESAGTLPVGTNYLSIPMYGSNHEQMKNDSNSAMTFNNLFNGLYGTMFQID